MSDFKFSTEPFLDSDQAAAAILRIHPKTLQRLARCGQVTGYRIGKLWRFHASDLEGRNDSFSSTLDADTAQRYALSTTCARN
jgi:excisionase family DNA binding protein